MPFQDFRQFLDVLRQRGELIDINRPVALNDVGKAIRPDLGDVQLLAQRRFRQRLGANAAAPARPDHGAFECFHDSNPRASSSWPGIDVRGTASLRSPMSRPSTSRPQTQKKDVDARDRPGHDGYCEVIP